MIEGNRVSSFAVIPSSIAILLQSVTGLVVNNRISEFASAIEIINIGIYRDNMAIGTTFPYSGGTNAGNNQ